MRFFSFSPPNIGVHFGTRSLVLSVVERTKGGPRLRAHRVLPLPEGIIRPSSVEPNLSDVSAVAGLMRDLLKGLGHMEHQVASVSIPDPSIRTSMIFLETLPVKTVERDKLIRWAVEKNSAVPVKDARVVYQPLKSSNGHRFIVSSVQMSILKQFEDVLLQADLVPGIVDAESFHTFNIYRKMIAESCTEERDFVFLNVGEHFYTIMIFSDNEPDFIRVKSIRESMTSDSSEKTFLADRIFEDLEGSFTFYEERTSGKQVRQLFLAGHRAGDALAKRASEELRLDVALLEPARLKTIGGLDKIPREQLDILVPSIAAVVARS